MVNKNGILWKITTYNCQKEVLNVCLDIATISLNGWIYNVELCYGDGHLPTTVGPKYYFNADSWTMHTTIACWDGIGYRHHMYPIRHSFYSSNPTMLISKTIIYLNFIYTDITIRIALLHSSVVLTFKLLHSLNSYTYLKYFDLFHPFIKLPIKHMHIIT